ncbi:MAG: hypothetical protein ABL871_06825 [Terricaulis sp.]
MDALTTVTVLLRRWVPLAFGWLTLGCATTPNFDALAPIPAHARELRVQVHYFPLAASSAYVVRPGAITVYQFDGAHWTSHEITTSTANQALTAVTPLIEMDGKNISCGVVDGNVYRIEGVIDGQRFALTASNPDLCQDMESAQVRAVLELITRDFTPVP